MNEQIVRKELKKLTLDYKSSLIDSTCNFVIGGEYSKNSISREDKISRLDYISKILGVSERMKNHISKNILQLT